MSGRTVVQAAFWLLLSGLVAAADSPALPKPGAAWPNGGYAQLDRLPDWGGVWVLMRPRPGTPAQPAARPLLKGEYLARYEAWAKSVRENAGLVPRETSNCMPPGMPGMLGTAQYPIEFLFTPGRVSMHHEAWMQWRSIFTDGRGHPADWDPGIFGHSIGHWEGATLVVETVGIKTVTELGGGMKHSPKLTIQERMHLEKDNPDVLVIEVTMVDPEALEAPFVRTHRFQRQRDWNLMEFICAENDRNPVNEQGFTTLQ
jgi:hypothetical protein